LAYVLLLPEQVKSCVFLRVVTWLEFGPAALDFSRARIKFSARYSVLCQEPSGSLTLRPAPRVSRKVQGYWSLVVVGSGGLLR